MTVKLLDISYWILIRNLKFIMWLFLALLGNAVLAVVGVTDKLILTKSVPKPIVFVFYSTIFILPLFLFLPFGVIFPTVWGDHFIFAVSGICFALGLWALYIGFQESEISHIGPLVGAATPLFVFLLANIFLGEKFTAIKLLAIFVLIFGSLVVSFEKSKLHNGWHRGMAWGVLAGLLFAVSHVTAKYAYDAYGFYNGFVWTKLWIGAFTLFLLPFPSVRALFRRRRDEVPPSSQAGAAGLVVVNKLLGILGVVLVQYAIALGSVSLVNALSGVQYAILIILVALISKFWPKILKENYTRKEIWQEASAVAIIGFGLVLLLR